MGIRDGYLCRNSSCHLALAKKDLFLEAMHSSARNNPHLTLQKNESAFFPSTKFKDLVFEEYGRIHVIENKPTGRETLEGFWFSDLGEKVF